VVHAQASAAHPECRTLETSTADSQPISVEELARRLQRLETQNAKLTEQNLSLTRRLEEMTKRLDQMKPAPTPIFDAPASMPSALESRSESLRALPIPDGSLAGRGAISEIAPGGVWPGPESSPGGWPLAQPEPPSFSRFLVGDYDDERGAFVVVRPRDEQRVPFELRLDIFTQARYLNFSKSADVWIDSTGTTQPIRSFDSVEIMRNFVQFSGFALDPRLQFSAIVFSSTALNDTVYLGWLNYRFSDALDVRVGNWLVPGTREWVESFRYTLGADRLMATTFFRPNISPGIWVQGEPIKNLYYVAMVANSFNRFTQGVERIGSSKAFGATVWWEPRGEFGPGPSDLEDREVLTPRIGTSVALSQETNQGISAIGTRNPEDTILRLSNGTPLFRRDALGPGVVLTSTNVQLWAIDAGLKYRGLSLTGEYLLRWLNGFETIGKPTAIGSLLDQGGLLQAGYFVIPSRFELFARTSFVTGRFGGGNEFGGGVNWYPLANRAWRFTFEVLRVNNSPAQNLLTGYRAGERGMLYQLQWFTDF
jgi:hypothetical protein